MHGSLVSAECYRFDRDEWTCLADVPEKSCYNNGVVFNDLFYFTGNEYTKIWQYNPRTGVYTAVSEKQHGSNTAIINTHDGLFVMLNNVSKYQFSPDGENWLTKTHPSTLL
jgi:hypothetical protein